MYVRMWVGTWGMYAVLVCLFASVFAYNELCACVCVCVRIAGLNWSGIKYIAQCNRYDIPDHKQLVHTICSCVCICISGG